MRKERPSAKTGALDRPGLYVVGVRPVVSELAQGEGAGEQAAIAAPHAQAPSYSETDWPQILAL